MKNLFKYVLPGLLMSVTCFADKAKLLLTDLDALQARVDIIQQARKEILVEYFSVWNDEQSVGGFALLQKAAQKGIKVKVIMDSLSNRVPRALISALQMHSYGPDGEQNLQIKVYNPLSLNLAKATHRDHSKMLIVDNHIMISGGRNVGDKYFGFNKVRNYKDADVIVAGQIVDTARENFMKVWNSQITEVSRLYESDPEKLAENACAYVRNDNGDCENLRQNAIAEYKKQISRIDQSVLKITDLSDDTEGLITNTGKDWTTVMTECDDIEFMSHEPEFLVTKKTNTLTTQLKNKVLAAQKEVLIVSPYLIPTAGLHEVFRNLLDRGIVVKVITNSLRSTDNLFAQAGYRAEKQKMTEMGLEIYEYNGPNTMHAKMAILDRSAVLIGTYNLDPRSMNLNREIAFAITGNKEINAQFLDQYTSVMADSTLVAKDKVALNTEKDFEGVSSSKKFLLKAIGFILPLIKDQI